MSEHPAPPRSPSRLSSIALSVLLGLLLSAITAILIRQLVPDFFGSCFEGSCGYMALFLFTPAMTLILSPLLWLLVRRRGPLSHLILWFLILFIGGFFVLPRPLWVLGLGGIFWMILRLRGAQHAARRRLRDLL